MTVNNCTEGFPNKLEINTERYQLFRETLNDFRSGRPITDEDVKNARKTRNRHAQRVCIKNGHLT